MRNLQISKFQFFLIIRTYQSNILIVCCSIGTYVHLKALTLKSKTLKTNIGQMHDETRRVAGGGVGKTTTKYLAPSTTIHFTSSV